MLLIIRISGKNGSLQIVPKLLALVKSAVFYSPRAIGRLIIHFSLPLTLLVRGKVHCRCGHQRALSRVRKLKNLAHQV